MLSINAKAAVKAITMRKQVHGDEMKKAVSVRLRFPAVPLEAAREFVTQLHLFWGTELEAQFPEIDYLPVTRKISDVIATIGGVKLPRGEVKAGAKIYPRGNRTVEVDLTFNSLIDKGLDKLHDALSETVAVDLLQTEPVSEIQPQAPQAPTLVTA